LLGSLRGVRLLLAALLLTAGLLGRLARRLLSLLGRLPGGLLPLLGDPPGGVLGLARGLPGRILRLARHLSGLVGRLAGGLLRLARRLTGGVLRLTRDLPDLVGHSSDGASASPVPAATGESANGFLGLTRNLPRLVGRLTRNLSSLIGRLAGGLLRLACYLARLVCGLTRHLLGLAGCLSRGVLRLLGRSLRELLHLLLGLLDGLVRYVHDVLVLSRLIHRVFEFHVGVDHLLDLGLRVALGELLGVLLQLGAVAPDLAPEAAHGPPVEVLGVLHGLLLQLLLKILSLLCHFVSFVLVDLRFR
jgi:hypothetical protein